jgi:hypothetical protein
LGFDIIGHCEKIGSYEDAFLNGYQNRAVRICRHSSDFCLWCWDEERSSHNKGGYKDELLARILHAAASVMKREDQLRTTTGDLRTRAAKCTEVDGGMYEHLS